jgi:uncharacterized membrane protein
VIDLMRPATDDRRSAMMGLGWGMDAGAWVWMLILMSVWFVGLAAVVWLIVRATHRTPSEDPTAILRVRLARGEITPEEFERVKLALDPRVGA